MKPYWIKNSQGKHTRIPPNAVSYKDGEWVFRTPRGIDDEEYTEFLKAHKEQLCYVREAYVTKLVLGPPSERAEFVYNARLTDIPVYEVNYEGRSTVASLDQGQGQVHPAASAND